MNQTHRVERDWITKTGLRAVVVIALMDDLESHLCGYVSVGPDSAHYGKCYTDLDNLSFEVHGGLTYGDGKCVSEYPVISKNMTWFGFDAHHSCDRTISLELAMKWYSNMNGTVRTLDYMIGECELLARELCFPA